MDKLAMMDDKVIKQFGELISKFLTQYMAVIKCAIKSCSLEINQAAADKELVVKFTNANLEQDKTAKMKMLLELSNKRAIYNINICAIKNCKNCIEDLIITFQEYLAIIPKSSPKYKTIEKIITEIEKIFKSKTLNYELYNKKINHIKKLITTL